MIFSRFDEERGRVSENDFLVERLRSGSKEQEGKISRALLEGLAFRRSQLFGLSVASRFVNVMFPCAVLEYVGEYACGEVDDKASGGNLILQPFLSLMRDSRNSREFREMYSLTLFAIPVEGDQWCPRKMSKREIESIVSVGWGLADSPPRRATPQYTLSGRLRDYAAELGGPEVDGLTRGGGNGRGCIPPAGGRARGIRNSAADGRGFEGPSPGGDETPDRQ